MMTTAQRVHPIQNMGLIDRALRCAAGAWVVGTLVFYYQMQSARLSAPAMFYAIAIGAYFIWTAITGWEPFYALSHVRSGNDGGRHPCGTFPFQVKAMVGRAPKFCDIDVERSLEACHNEPEERPTHNVWRVEQEPMIYPDDATFDEFIMRHMPKPGQGVRPVRRVRKNAA